jgi:DNA-binding NtrC family response regulator
MVSVAKCILVVDDVEDWQATLSGVLTDAGYAVKAVGDRKSALAALEAGKFDMAVIDIRLDETDEANIAGLGLAREIQIVLPNVPVVIITGYPSLETIQEALQPDEQGRTLAVNFVLKANVSELVDIVRSKLDPSPL